MEDEKWEYELFVTTDVPTAGLFKRPSRDAIRDHLNTLGEAGWEIINAQFAVVDGSNFFFSAVLKRRKR